ncbi:DNA gyrase inhibitor YacG [Entomobacter blattae]|uniref:DNA gyrase inhibitor YacG n=1 Tax=Entomobacter blattae TaxID=2762277 RepID=A0A7H1NS91_9PROT|nr:DNA gyrase inhibitor YacG [Entomobacter blattae]QNT78651.1 DNA gyrase inhibitor YacG [Entomobacter blattae]
MSSKSSTSQAVCPICHKPTIDQFRPFCSAHCSHIDLGKWLNGQYALPDKESDPENEKILLENHKTRLDQNDSIG